jgi:hypothetical protein
MLGIVSSYFLIFIFYYHDYSESLDIDIISALLLFVLLSDHA